MPSLLTDFKFHEGEIALQQMLNVPPMDNPTNPGLAPRYTSRILRSPLVALGTLDDEERPWTTIWGGERGFARPIAEDVLGVSSVVDTRWDPVFEALWGGGDGEEVVQAGRPMSAVTIDLETRDRVKVAGTMIAGAVVAQGAGTRVQMGMLVTESLGNCPKYLNKKIIRPHGVEGAELGGQGLPLPDGALALLDKADLFFLSSVDASGTMDTNHRGGSPGFVRIMKNEAEEVVLVFPDYSGNRLYQTLGNLKVNPRVGIVVPDFITGDVLYLTGSTSILIGEEASSVMARTNVAVSVTVTDARYVKSGLPFRGSIVDYSPYNPPVRHLLSEQGPHISSQPGPGLTATLVGREPLTPSISRFTWELSGPRARWTAGQHVTFDFSRELGNGYAHMRDEDPQSLNDDYVRTFTVSNTPLPEGEKKKGEEDVTVVEVTAKRHGPATALLWRHNLRARLELPVMGFGGEESFRMGRGRRSVFVAGGVGITPVLAQAGGLLSDSGSGSGSGPLEVLWTLRGEDVPLAVDSFERIEGLARVTRLFVTGDAAEAGDGLQKVRELGAEVETRRIGREDLAGLKGRGTKFFLCAAPKLMASLNGWLDGEDVVWEDFGY